MQSSEPVLAAYQDALETALAVHHPDPGVIELAGRDRLDLLNRMSTADLLELAPFQLRQTVFTDPLGRTIDVVWVLTRDQDLVMVTSPGKEAQLRAWLHKHIFFQDQVSVGAPEPGWTLWGVYGPAAGQALATLHVPAPADDQVVVLEGGLAWGVTSPRSGVRVLIRPGVDLTAWPELSGGPAASAAYEVMRVEAGLPETGREILEDSIPLEVGLAPAVSFTKGCYTGQEIIARMESRGKLAKRLAGLELPGPAAAGTKLFQAGRSVGTLTSVVESPRLGWIGLAVVKPDAISTHGGQVLLQADDGEASLHSDHDRVSLPADARPARLIELPFDLQSRPPVAAPLAGSLETP